MPIFDEWTLEDAKAAVASAIDDAERLTANRAYMEGDHWQNWKGWTGPMPAAEDPEYAALVREIERGFVSRGVIREVIQRHVNGVLGRDVKWQIVSRNESEQGEAQGEGDQAENSDQPLIDEATDLLREWIELRKLNSDYDDVGRILCYAGRTHQRLFVPPGLLDENGLLPPADIATNLARIHISVLHPDEAVIYTDPNTQEKCSVYLYTAQTSTRPSQQKQGQQHAELTYLDNDLTVIRIVGPEADDQPGDERLGFAYNMGGRLYMSSMERQALITDPVVRQQRLLDKTLSMKGRNMDMAGFRERVVTNAQMGGTYQTDEHGNKVFVPDGLPHGPSTLLNLTGYVLKDRDGNETALATPGYQSIDPVPVTSFLQTEESVYLAILSEVNQRHYAMSNDATASGVSRETAMAGYLIDLLQTKQQIDLGFAWLLETSLELAATLSGQAGRYRNLRVSAEATVDPGPISPEMIRVILDLWREEKITLRTGLNWIGIEDIDGEIAGLEQEAQERAERWPESTANERQFNQDFWNQLAGLEA